MSLQGVVESLHGWCTVEKAERLYQLIKESDSKLTVELGVFAGRSFIPMAIAHRDKQSGFAIGVDAWKAGVCIEGTNAEANNQYWKNVNYKEVYQSCINAIDQYDLKDYCDTLRMRSSQAGILFADNIIDVLHQDSNHNIETIIAELKLWSPKVKKGGYWIIDDCDWVEAVDGYKKIPDYGFQLVEDHIHWQIWRKIK